MTDSSLHRHYVTPGAPARCTLRNLTRVPLTVVHEGRVFVMLVDPVVAAKAGRKARVANYREVRARARPWAPRVARWAWGYRMKAGVL